MIYFRIFLMAGTALFMAYHTSVFIQSIESSKVLAWLLAFLIEGFLMNLAFMRTFLSRVLLIPLFLISVLSASASFVAQNEQLLESLIGQKAMIEQIRQDLKSTQQAYVFGEKYITKTLQRERMLQDQLREIVSHRTGYIALWKAIVFFVLVLILQSVSVYTAMSLKNDISPDIRSKKMTEKDSEVPVSATETPAETSVSALVQRGETDINETATETSTDTDILAPLSVSKTPEELARMTGLSKSTVYRFLRGQKISPGAEQKILKALKGVNP